LREMSDAASSPLPAASPAGNSVAPTSSPAAAANSSPAVVEPTSTPQNPGTPHSVPRTPSSFAKSRGSSVQPSPQRSDLGRRASNVRNNAAAGDVQIESSTDNPRTLVWGTNIEVQATKESARKFFQTFQEPDAEDGTFLYLRLLEEAHLKKTFYINLDCSHLHSFDRTLYNKLVSFPTEMITIFDLVCLEIYVETYPEEADSAVAIQVRTYNMADGVTCMRNLNPSDMDKLVSIKGMVIRTSNIVPDIQRAYFQCISCKASEEVDIMNGRIQEPANCKECKASQSLEIKHNRCLFKDKQLIRLQEAPEDIPEGETPQTVNLCAFEDLVDVSKPGDRVTVTGIYRAMPMRVKAAQRSLKAVYKTYIDVIHFSRSEKGRMGDGKDMSGEQAMEGGGYDERKAEREAKCRALAAEPDIYQKLIASFAPSIYEMDDVKKGLLCQLFGGSGCGKTTRALRPDEAAQPQDASHTQNKFRGDINCLLVGDPGVSKSQLLQYVHKIAPRGIYTSGKGSSAVGLTAYITKDPETKELVLESGALVLSDRGICCIDEFDKMGESARAILHEAMEQQTISVAKAGIICSLNARTSILAAANPIQSRYNPQLSVVDNMNLPPTLLSRFDLIFLILDQPNPASDRRLAKHLVALYLRDPPAAAAIELDLQTFADYVSFARTECHPVLQDDAVTTLIDGYVQMRRMSANKHTISATPRQLESIIRLAEAHAKMRLSDTVEVGDVEEAIRLLRVATQSAATDPRTGKIDMDLITTGKSASSRQRMNDLVRTLKETIAQRSEASISFQALMDLLLQGPGVEVSTQELQSAVRQLKDDDYITTSGHGFNMNIVRMRA